MNYAQIWSKMESRLFTSVSPVEDNSSPDSAAMETADSDVSDNFVPFSYLKSRLTITSLNSGKMGSTVIP